MPRTFNKHLCHRCGAMIGVNNMSAHVRSAKCKKGIEVVKKAKRLPTRKAEKAGYKVLEAFEEGFAMGVERAKREGVSFDVPAVDFSAALGGTALGERSEK